MLSLKNRLNTIYSNLNHSVNIIHLDQIFNNVFNNVKTLLEAYMSELNSENKSNRNDLNNCENFIEKVIDGLKNWLKKNEYASTGLIIKNWLPRWNLGIDEAQANNCLKHLIETGILEREGIIFEPEADGELIRGKFYLA